MTKEELIELKGLMCYINKDHALGHVLTEEYEVAYSRYYMLLKQFTNTNLDKAIQESEE